MRRRGSMKFRLWLLLRSRRLCEDDMDHALKACWDATCRRFGL